MYKILNEHKILITLKKIQCIGISFEQFDSRPDLAFNVADLMPGGDLPEAVLALNLY